MSIVDTNTIASIQSINIWWKVITVCITAFDVFVFCPFWHAYRPQQWIDKANWLELIKCCTHIFVISMLLLIQTNMKFDWSKPRFIFQLICRIYCKLHTINWFTMCTTLRRIGIKKHMWFRISKFKCLREYVHGAKQNANRDSWSVQFLYGQHGNNNNKKYTLNKRATTRKYIHLCTFWSGKQRVPRHIFTF